MTNNLAKLLIIPSLLISASCLAQQAEPKAGEPIFISSNKQLGQLKEGVGIFEKNVEITHGNRLIRADRLEVHKRDELGNNKQLLIATGKPAYFEEKQPDGTIMSASANEVKYDVEAKQLTLVGNAKVSQAGQEISAKSIIYDMEQQLISAKKDQDSSDRVHTILVPNESKKDKKGQP